MSENYAYRPDGKRVWRRQANGVEEVYFYGLDGEKLAQLTGTFPSGTSSWRLYYYFAGMMVARSDAEAVPTDRLGSVSLRAPYGQAAERFQYYPYGEEGDDDAAAGEVYARIENGIHDASRHGQNQRYIGHLGHWSSARPCGGEPMLHSVGLAGVCEASRLFCMGFGVARQHFAATHR